MGKRYRINVSLKKQVYQILEKESQKRGKKLSEMLRDLAETRMEELGWFK
jgi:metal-responsive CopG/Arc/MetJ family transcriptional regulator